MYSHKLQGFDFIEESACCAWVISVSIFLDGHFYPMSLIACYSGVMRPRDQELWWMLVITEPVLLQGAIICFHLDLLGFEGACV